ncbi:MAG: helix-turn-helix transcriptional regulator [Clostridiales bacterium]|nr:helix-turn-helix transcriptional regulator [Clostridiales bacterium]
MEELVQYNMLHKRIHQDNVCTASLDFLGYVKFDPKEQGLTHKYPEWSVSFVLGNEGHFFFEDRRIIVSSGKAIFIPPYLRHYLYCPGPNSMNLLYFGFTGDMIRGDELVRFNQEVSKIAYMHTFLEAQKQIVAEMEAKNDKYTLMSNSGILLEHLLRIFNSFSQPRCFMQDGRYRKKKLVEDIKRLLISNLSVNLSLCEVAEQFYISERYLSDIFTELTGMTFKAYTLMLHMEHASRLLYSSTQSIAEIAAEVGYSDVHYFSKKFKEYFGCTPGSLRKK